MTYFWRGGLLLLTGDGQSFGWPYNDQILRKGLMMPPATLLAIHLYRKALWPAGQWGQGWGWGGGGTCVTGWTRGRGEGNVEGKRPLSGGCVSAAQHHHSNNNNEYLERLTHTGPKCLHILRLTHTGPKCLHILRLTHTGPKRLHVLYKYILSKFNAYNMNTHTHTHRLAHTCMHAHAQGQVKVVSGFGKTHHPNTAMQLLSFYLLSSLASKCASVNWTDCLSTTRVGVHWLWFVSQLFFLCM